MRLSIAVTTHNEGKCFREMIDAILRYTRNMRCEYEIVVLDDMSTDPVLLSVFKDTSMVLRVHRHPLADDFGAHKNHLSALCSGDYILQLDADELPTEGLMARVEQILTGVPAIEVFEIPRLNTVDGLTERHIKKWKWRISGLPSVTREELLDRSSLFFDLLRQHELILSCGPCTGQVAMTRYMRPLVKFPDYQKRLWRNLPHIRWQGRVHETLVGYHSIARMAAVPESSILHHKDIVRQEAQNKLYAKIRRRSAQTEVQKPNGK